MSARRRILQRVFLLYLAAMLAVTILGAALGSVGLIVRRHANSLSEKTRRA